MSWLLLFEFSQLFPEKGLPNTLAFQVPTDFFFDEVFLDLLGIWRKI